MYADPTQVQFAVWFIPEVGIDQPPTQHGVCNGAQQAYEFALGFVESCAADGAEVGYESMYAYARAALAKWAAHPVWSVSVPVNYGTVVITG